MCQFPRSFKLLLRIEKMKALRKSEAECESKAVH
jgi:hypothetical protein